MQYCLHRRQNQKQPKRLCLSHVSSCHERPAIKATHELPGRRPRRSQRASSEGVRTAHCKSLCLHRHCVLHMHRTHAEGVHDTSRRLPRGWGFVNVRLHFMSKRHLHYSSAHPQHRRLGRAGPQHGHLVPGAPQEGSPRPCGPHSQPSVEPTQRGGEPLRKWVVRLERVWYQAHVHRTGPQNPSCVTPSRRHTVTPPRRVEALARLHPRGQPGDAASQRRAPGPDGWALLRM